MYFKENKNVNDVLVKNSSINTEFGIEVSESEKVLKEEIPTFIKIANKHENRIYKRREDIDRLIHDTLSNAKDKFLKIFKDDLIGNKALKITFFKDSDFATKTKEPNRNETRNFIKYYWNLLDSISHGKVDIDSNGFVFHEGDTSYFAFKFKNGITDTLKWNPNDWGAFEFQGYFMDKGFYWIQQVDHGEADYYINSENGEIIDFLPHFSNNKKCYYDIETYDGYGDVSYFKFLLGKDLLTPEIDITYEFAPFLVSNKYYSRFGFDNFKWISDNELTFNFYHIQTKEYENSDTLYYDNIGVKINYAP